jgi:acyl-CoA thioesterase
MAAELIDLQATDNPHRWSLPVRESLCVGFSEHRYLYGGAGLAAAILAMEKTCKRPVVWAAAQYLSYARPASVLDLDVTVAVQGHFSSQARVIGHVADREILTANAALGERPSEFSQQWAEAPRVPRPEDGTPIFDRLPFTSGIYGALEARLVKGRFGRAQTSAEPAADSADGHMVIWVRVREKALDAATLALVADFVPIGVSLALGRNAFGNSLDNTIRIRRIVPSDWLLCDIRIYGVHGGFGHGRMILFAEDGTLMATASQSFILRMVGKAAPGADELAGLGLS